MPCHGGAVGAADVERGGGLGEAAARELEGELVGGAVGEHEPEAAAAAGAAAAARAAAAAEPRRARIEQALDVRGDGGAFERAETVCSR